MKKENCGKDALIVKGFVYFCKQLTITIMDKKKIMIAEDEPHISDFIRRGLEDFDYDVEVANDGREAWDKLNGGTLPDLLILDIRMPHLSGLEVCRLVRQHFGYQLPLLMLTALNTTDDIVMGLHAGADDYLVKPFKFMELLARIKALLRRSEQSRAAAGMQYAGLQLFPATHKVSRDGITVDLSQTEYRLLEYLISHHDEVLSRRQLLKDVWEKDFDTNTNIVDVYVRYLRSKIDAPFPQKLIHTIVGIGYTLKKE